MDKRKVYIRADGDPQIGLGHLVRCMALGHMLKANFTINFVCKHIPLNVIKEIKEAGFLVTHIQDESDFLPILKFNDIVILDHYDLDSNYQKNIKEKECKLVCIDDLHDREFYADLIINHTPGVEPSDYQAQTYTQFALGLDYVLLRPEFLESVRQERTVKQINTVLICFGGSDFKNITNKVLNIVVKEKRFKKIYVIIGVAFNYLKELKEIIKRDERIQLESSLSANEMLNFMKNSDLAIIPASGILLEVLSARCKVISGFYAVNQKDMYTSYKEMDLFIDAKEFEGKDITQAIDLAFDKEIKSFSFFNGLSGKNILSKFIDLDLELRQVLKNDCKLIFEWANDPLVRRNALNSQEIKWEDHLKWFHSRINDDKTKMYILVRETENIGQLRFEKENDYWKIDYSIDKRYRGMGMGKRIIELALREINGSVKAWVKQDNIASCKVFEKLGFVKESILNDSVNQYYLSK